MSLRAALREFRRPALWLGLWCFGWLLCVVLSLVPSSSLGLVEVPGGDKFGHVFAYALLAAWASWIFAGTRAQWRAALALCALGLAMELAQGAFTRHRMMDGWDLLADVLGVFIGWWLGLRRPALLQQLDRLAFA